MSITIIHGAINQQTQSYVDTKQHKFKGYTVDKEFEYRFDDYKRVEKRLGQIEKKTPHYFKRLNEIALEIKSLQLRYRDLLLPFNKEVCSKCNECCCSSPISYLHIVDYIYYELLKERLPDVVLRNKAKMCMYLDKEKGCIIPKHLRPRTCILAFTFCGNFDYSKPFNKEMDRVSKLLEIRYSEMLLIFDEYARKDFEQLYEREKSLFG